MASIYTGQHAREVTAQCEVTQYDEGSYRVELMLNDGGLSRLHVSGLQLWEAETISSELLAAVKRARTLALADGTSPAPAEPETPSTVL